MSINFIVFGLIRPGMEPPNFCLKNSFQNFKTNQIILQLFEDWYSDNK